MRKIIRGRVYNTQTARLIGRGGEEALYRSKSGQYFIHGEDGGEKIVPITEEEAKVWGQERMSALAYDSEWGEVQERKPRERINWTLDACLVAELRDVSEETGVPISRIVEDAIRAAGYIPRWPCQPDEGKTQENQALTR